MNEFGFDHVRYDFMLNTSSSAVSRESWPNLYLVGAAKSGTSAVAHYLSMHPDIFMSKVKEPYYFVDGFGVSSKEEYLDLFRNRGGARYCGEASTGYLFDKDSPEKIRSVCPDAKIIIILRNPIDMAFSLWQFMQRQGNETSSFYDAFLSDRSANFEFLSKCAGWPMNYLYFERAKYFSQVKRYYDCFPKEQIFLDTFESFFSDLTNGMEGLYDFLGVDVLHSKYEIINEGGGAKFAFLRALNQRRYPLLKKLLPVELRDAVRGIVRKINLDNAKKQKLDHDTRNVLATHLKEDISKLEQLVGRRFWKEFI